MGPFDLVTIVNTLPYYLIFLGIGVGFGAILEMSGFGDSKKLAAQFYLTDMTVLKVMFTAIIVASVLVFLSAALGLLDFSMVWVNPTYLVPGIVGGLIMGVGFVIGGFCPGTSVVAASTLKLDGVAFVSGVGLGTLLFSETASLLGGARHATYMGRFTLPELFGLPYGVTVVLLVSMALVMFYGAELAEAHFGRGETLTKRSLIPTGKIKIAAAGTLFSGAVVVALMGQPTPNDKWEAIAEKSGISLEGRAPYIHPGEVVEWREDTAVYANILDVRSEGDYNRFHILGSKRLMPSQVEDGKTIKGLKNAPANTLQFVISNTEEDATAAWKVLVGAGVPNVYIIEGGINNWLKIYPPDPCVAKPVTGRETTGEELAWSFVEAVGDNCYAAHPEARFKEHATDCYMEAHPELKNRPGEVVRPVPFDRNHKPTFTRKVKMKKAAAAAGGCG